MQLAPPLHFHLLYLNQLGEGVHWEWTSARNSKLFFFFLFFGILLCNIHWGTQDANKLRQQLATGSKKEREKSWTTLPGNKSGRGMTDSDFWNCLNPFAFPWTTLVLNTEYKLCFGQTSILCRYLKFVAHWDCLVLKRSWIAFFYSIMLFILLSK